MMSAFMSMDFTDWWVVFASIVCLLILCEIWRNAWHQRQLQQMMLKHVPYEYTDQADLVTKLAALRCSHVDVVRKSVQGAK